MSRARVATAARVGVGRFILCRPHGGLHDTLGVVESCWRYAEATGRTLVVDARHSHFCRRFGDYFRPRQPSPAVHFDLSRGLLASMNELPCFPPAVQGRLGAYATEIQLHETLSDLEWRLPVEASERTPLSIDLTADYAEAVLLHQLFGGMPGAVDLLGRVRLTARAAGAVRRRLASLPARPYVGVHVRNSDLRSDYVGFLAAHADALAGRTVLVCSDDGDVVRHARATLTRSEVISSSTVPPSHGVPYQLPFHQSRRARRTLAIDTLVDLFALARATEVIHPLIINRTAQLSGFSKLAVELSQRPQLVDELLA